MNTLVVLCALVCAAAAGAVRDKRGLDTGLFGLSGLSGLSALPGYYSAPDIGYSAPALSYSPLADSYSASALSYSAPAAHIVSEDKVVHVPREVSVPQVVHVRKLVSEPQVVTVNKLVPAESYSAPIELDSAGLHSGYSSGYASSW